MEKNTNILLLECFMRGETSPDEERILSDWLHSQEAKEQILKTEGKLPAAVVACVGGGSNAMGAFYNFIEDQDVELIGCEAAGKGVDTALIR